MERRPRLAVALLIGASLVVGARALAEIRFEPAFARSAALGPDRALGAIVYNHGQAQRADPNPDPPFYLDSARDSGWDVFRLVRPKADERGDAGVDALAERAVALRAQGYRRVVSVGQSFGSWITFEAGARAGLFDAIVAAVPARYGSWSNTPGQAFRRNFEIVSIARYLAPMPAMVIFFDHDDYDPGGRAAPMREALADKHSTYAVLDRPPGFAGHASAHGTAFARLYAACIVEFLRLASPPGEFQCRPRAASAAEIERAFGMSRVTLAAESDLSPLLGHWWGWYQNGGREVLLAIDRVGADGTVTAQYGFGPLNHAEGYRVEPAAGRLQEGALRLVTSGHARLEYRLAENGRLFGSWNSADGKVLLPIELRRID